MARKKYNEMSYWQLRIRPDHGLFVGFASVDDSEIAMAVRMLMLSWAVMISPCYAVMRLPGYLSWNVPFDGADISAPSRKELVHTSMLCQRFKRRYDGTGICLFHFIGNSDFG